MYLSANVNLILFQHTIQNFLADKVCYNQYIIYIYIYIHTHTHIYIYTHNHTRTYIYIYIYIHIYIYLYTYIYIYTHVYTHTHTHTHIYIYIYIHKTTGKIQGKPRGLMAKMRRLEVIKFELQSRHNVYFQINTIYKSLKRLISLEPLLLFYKDSFGIKSPLKFDMPLNKETNPNFGWNRWLPL